MWLALVGASLADFELGRELRQRYRQMREATAPSFSNGLKG